MDDAPATYLDLDSAKTLLSSLAHTKQVDSVIGDIEVEWLATRSDGGRYVVATGTFYGAIGIVCIDPYGDWQWGQFSDEQAYELLDQCTPHNRRVGKHTIGRVNENILVVGMYPHWRQDCIKYLRPKGARIVEVDTPNEAANHWRDQVRGLRPRIRCVVLADAISCQRSLLTRGARGPQPGFGILEIGRLLHYSDYLSGQPLSGPLGELMKENFIRRRIQRH